MSDATELNRDNHSEGWAFCDDERLRKRTERFDEMH